MLCSAMLCYVLARSWGRNGEGGLEDAYAMGELAQAWTQGFQARAGNKTSPLFCDAILSVQNKNIYKNCRRFVPRQAHVGKV